MPNIDRRAEEVIERTIAEKPTKRVGQERGWGQDIEAALALLYGGGVESGEALILPDRFREFTGNAGFTLTAGESAEWQLHSGTLTANRIVTLATLTTAGLAIPAGAHFRVTRTGAGAFNLDVGGLKNLAQNTWCDVVYDGAAWRLMGYGAL